MRIRESSEEDRRQPDQQGGDQQPHHQPLHHPQPNQPTQKEEGGPGDKAVTTACSNGMPGSISLASQGGTCPGTVNSSTKINVSHIEERLEEQTEPGEEPLPREMIAREDQQGESNEEDPGEDHHQGPGQEVVGKGQGQGLGHQHHQGGLDRQQQQH